MPPLAIKPIGGPAALPPGTRSTVHKALRVLLCFNERRTELAITDIAKLLQLDKSDVSRLVATLKYWDFLAVNPINGRIRIGPTAFRVGSLFTATNTWLADRARPLLTSLTYATNCSSHLTILSHGKILVLSAQECSLPLRIIMRPGDTRDLHATAAGKLFLAYRKISPSTMCSDGKSFQRFTDKTITSPRQLSNQLIEIRERGFALNYGEYTPGAGAVAYPIFLHDNYILAAVSTVFPTSIQTVSPSSKLLPPTRSCANKLTKLIATLPISQRSILGEQYGY